MEIATVFPPITSDNIEEANRNGKRIIEETYINSANEEYMDTSEGNLTSLTEYEKNNQIKVKLKMWTTSFNINHTALKDLFEIWNMAIPNLLPMDPRTFLNTPQIINLVKLENGTYWHNGLKSNLIISLQKYPHITSISLNINVDGLPIYKSSKSEFWPILCNIYEIPEVKPRE